MAPSSGPSSLSRRQQSVLAALTDALLPPLPVPVTQEPSAAARSYWEHRLSADPDFVRALQESVTDKLSPSDAARMKTLLTALSTAVGTSIIFGIPTMHPFTEWNVPERSALLLKLQHSSILPRRQIFQGVKRLICGLAYSYTAANNGSNPFWAAMGYPGPPQQQPESLSDDAVKTRLAVESQRGIQQALLSIDDTTADELTCDVVIVGSGAGGSVAAQVLSRAGYKVIILEKGSYVPPDQITNREADAFDRMYESHGLLTTTDGAITILAGSTLGGGTTINWSCCLPLPDHVRQEWVQEFGMEDFRTGGAYQQSLEMILNQIGALNHSGITHNQMNRHFQKGMEIIDFGYVATGQNLRRTEDLSAGYVCFGDRYANKLGGISVFLQEAVENGARIVPQCRVDRVIKTVDQSNGRSRFRATGVRCQVGKRRLTVNARKCVVVAAGALQTPCLLQQSKFRNKHIGRHLRLHPVTATMGFISSTKIDCFLGAPMTTVCNEYELGPYRDGYGAKIECPSTHPGLLAAGLQWTSPEQYKDRLRRLRNALPLISLQRDSGEGTVRLSGDGKSLKINYKLSNADKHSLSRVAQGALLILLASGAHEVSTGHIRDPGIQCCQDEQGRLCTECVERVQRYLPHVASLGMKPNEIGLFSAHQMGSCRMSTSPSTGAVDINGEAWECDDLYVMDTSLFPTASGANPMVTVLAIANMLSSRLGLRLRHQDKRISDGYELSRAKELAARRTAIRSRIELEREDRIASILNAVLHAVLWLAILLPLLSAWLLDTPSWLASYHN